MLGSNKINIDKWAKWDYDLYSYFLGMESMKNLLYLFFIWLLWVNPINARVLIFDRGNDFQALIDYASSGDTIIVSAKTASANPSNGTDPLCGNCGEHKTEVDATFGFKIINKSLVIIGADKELSILQTNAGYGVYIEGSENVVIKNLTITGGVRDSDGRATDAGLVVRNSKVVIENVIIRDNDNRSPDSAVVVGICGVVGREGADITISNCYIYNNGWDGVALYRGATAKINDTKIEKGRGAGIGVTWDASCVAYRNDVSGYWKGIGAFGTSWVIARNNFVHDNLGWGMIATGESYMDMANNDIYHNGNCGVAPWSTESRGRIVNNIIAENGWRDQWVCPCVGVWNYGDWAKWKFSNNIVWGNKDGNYQDIWDQSGFNGNLSADPRYTDSTASDYLPVSPIWNSGDSTISNIDGSRSHIGRFGGPQGK